MRRLIPILVIVSLGSARPALPQSLSELVSELFVFGEGCGQQPLCLDLSVEAGHGEHFIPDLQRGNQVILEFLGNATARAVTKLPPSATSGGPIDYTGPDGGLILIHSSLGPIYSERAETLGQGKFFVGFNVTGLHLTNISGIPADNLTLNFAHRDSVPPFGDPILERDIIQVSLDLDMDLVLATALVTYGLTDFLDLGVSIPIVRTTLSGSSVAQIIPASPEFPHRFGQSADSTPILRAANSVQGSAAGIGDIGVRFKFNLNGNTRRGSGRPPPKYGVAVLGDVRLATGNEEEFLGSGNTTGRMLAILSARYDNFTPHLNTGYLFRTGDLENDAFLATIGFDDRMADWATLAFDLITEWQVGDAAVHVPGAIVFDIPSGLSIDATNIPDRRENLVDASIGLKFQVRRGTVIIANVIIPAVSAGLRPDIIWTLGLEGVF